MFGHSLVLLLTLGLLAALPLASCEASPSSGSVPLWESTVSSVDGVEIAYTAGGRGEVALVFIHGGFANRSFWRHPLEAFAGECRVVAMDLAGHGASGRDRTAWTLEAFGQDVVAVIDALGIQRVVLVGNSMGGPVALVVAQLLPEHVVALIGVESLHDAHMRQDAERREAFARALEADFSGTVNTMAQTLFHEDADPALVDWVAAQMRTAAPEMGAPLMRHVADYDMAAAMRKVTIPIRGINGDLYPTNIEGNREVAPGYSAVVMENVGHFPMLEAPVRFNQALREMVGQLMATDR